MQVIGILKSVIESSFALRFCCRWWIHVWKFKILTSVIIPAKTTCLKLTTTLAKSQNSSLFLCSNWILIYLLIGLIFLLTTQSVAVFLFMYRLLYLLQCKQFASYLCLFYPLQNLVIACINQTQVSRCLENVIPHQQIHIIILDQF